MENLFDSINKEIKQILKKEQNELYAKVDKALEEYIFNEEFGMYETGEIDFEQCICEIILNNTESQLFNYGVNIKHKHINIEKTLKLVDEFIKLFPVSYQDDYYKLLNNNHIIFINNNNDNCSGLYSNDDDTIKIYVTNSVIDSSTIIHEFMHYTNYRDEVRTGTSEYLSEAISSSMELHFVDFIEKNYPQYKKDAGLLKREIYYGLYFECLKAKIFFMLFNKKINGEVINRNLVKGLIEELYKYNVTEYNIIEGLDYVINNILLDIDSIYYSSISYPIAASLAPILNDIYSKEGIKNGLAVNEHLKDMDIIDIFNLIGYDIDEEADTYPIINDLEEKYIKFKKKFW